MSRLSDAARGAFDLLIVGGGIVGAGIARDAALRGLRVALFELADFGSGTTAGSTRLVHGGLRYLEMLDFRLVRMDLRERERLLRNAPHLVRPLEFLVPVYGRNPFARWKLALGMLLYDLLSFDKSLPGRRWLTREQVAQAEPQLEARHLQGAATYYDAQVELPERLCLENLIDAREHGALTFNYAEVIQALGSDGRVTGLRVRDVLSGEQTDVLGRAVVNAAGPWFDRVAARLMPSTPPRLRTTKGIHLACPRVTRRALVLYSRVDRRLFFAIPWLGYTWVGTTDTDFAEEPGRANATREDAEYLMRSAREFLPALASEQALFSNAGVRALLVEEGSASSVSRQHVVIDEAGSGRPGLISVVGGKLTGYRAIAEEATNAVCRRLGIVSECRTCDRPLPGAREAAHPIPPAAGVGQATVDHLVSLYGSRGAEVLRIAATDAELAQPLAPDTPDIAAQVVFSVRAEQCLRVSDFLLRRTRLGFAPDQGRRALPRVAAWMARELGWDDARRQAECDAYLAHVARTQEFRAVGRKAAAAASGRTSPASGPDACAASPGAAAE
ncbi:MAG: glycerol-3-phosphate dehydrogenase/oxidase [Vicinamibacteria bacterium]